MLKQLEDFLKEIEGNPAYKSQVEIVKRNILAIKKG